MKDYSKIRTDYDVVQSLKFYFMLSSYLCSRGVNENIATQSLKEFVKEGAYWHKNDSKTLSEYYRATYETLPADFLDFMGISTKGDRDTLRIVDTKYIWIK